MDEFMGAIHLERHWEYESKAERAAKATLVRVAKK
jgi:hypothetical protein